ncbi:MAG TPA: FAD-binding oxidoreductase [Polyangia bacterium]|nr:FAD-binding oxidoreductase [Polyangia bacterium]
MRPTTPSDPGPLPHPDDNLSVWCADKPPYQPLPPLTGPTSADVAIIGGGFTGVSTALELARRYPERRIVLLEAHQLGHGASGRNGGLMLNWLHGVESQDLELARRIYDTTQAGIDRIVSLIREHRLDVGHRRGGCLEVLTDPRRADAAQAEVERLHTAGIPLQFLAGPALDERLRLRGASGAVLDPGAGHLDGIDFLRGLRPVLLSLGVSLYEGTPVRGIAEGETVRLGTPGGDVRARAVVLATNAYTPRLGYFKESLFPLLSHVVATAPLPAERWAELGIGPGLSGFSDDLDRLAYGCLTTRGQLVFGGGSNAAYSYRLGGRTHGAPSERAVRAIQRRLTTYFPDTRDLPLAHRWSGPVALTLTRMCTMGVRGQHRNIYYALGYSGHGITLANLAGRVLCDLYSGDDTPWRGLPFYQQRLHRIPPEPLRWLGYHVYTALTGRSPRRHL